MKKTIKCWVAWDERCDEIAQIESFGKGGVWSNLRDAKSVLRREYGGTFPILPGHAGN
jgi:hypothetical protein